MLKEFYELRGLRDDGRPTRETLDKYDLGFMAEKIGV